MIFLSYPLVCPFIFKLYKRNSKIDFISFLDEFFSLIGIISREIEFLSREIEFFLDKKEFFLDLNVSMVAMTTALW